MSGSGNPGGGISAMPSMHVAVSLWLALVMQAYFPRLQFLGWAYFTVILIGSVHLGWHYAVDGIVASAIAIAAWLSAPRILEMSSPRTNRSSSNQLRASM